MPLSRAIFREYDIRGIAGKDLTEEVASAVAGGFSAFLAEKGVKGAISVGRDNPYGHPTPGTLATLRRHGVPTLRTDEAGDITIEVGPHSMRLDR